MTTEQFAYWLQGFAEVHGEAPTPQQWEMIKEHLETCFVKVTNVGQQQDKILNPGTTGDIPDWLKQINQKNPGTVIPPFTITC